MYSSAAEQDVTVSAVLQVHPRLTIHSPLLHAVQKSRRVILLQKESFRDSSEILKLQDSSSDVMTSVQAVFLLPLVSLQKVLRSTSMQFLRSTTVLTVQRLQSPSHRREWPLLFIRLILISSWQLLQRKTLKQR